MSPSWLTNESTCQFEFGPFHRFHVCPARLIPVCTGEPTGWMPPCPESQIMISYEDALVAGWPDGAVPVQMSYLCRRTVHRLVQRTEGHGRMAAYDTSARMPDDSLSYTHDQAVGADRRAESCTPLAELLRTLA